MRQRRRRARYALDSAFRVSRLALVAMPLIAGLMPSLDQGRNRVMIPPTHSRRREPERELVSGSVKRLTS